MGTMIKVYFEDDRHITATLVAVFESETEFELCESVLRASARLDRCVVTTSLDEETSLRELVGE